MKQILIPLFIFFFITAQSQTVPDHLYQAKYGTPYESNDTENIGLGLVGLSCALLAGIAESNSNKPMSQTGINIWASLVGALFATGLTITIVGHHQRKKPNSF